jgi:hypothetical protein
MSTFECISISDNVNNRASQRSLYYIIRRYKKWAPLILSPIIERLKSEDIDVVKGALHTTHMPTIEHTVARNWEYLSHYVLTLFEMWDHFDRVHH